MNRITYLHPADVHGLSQLAVDGVMGTTGLVEQLHHAIVRISGPIGPAPEGRTRGITGLVYRSIHGVTGLVDATLNLAFNQVVPRWRLNHSAPEREHLLAAVNGVLGDHLAERNNPLAIRMGFRHQGRALKMRTKSLARAFDNPSSRLLIAVHGLGLNDLRWRTDGDRDIPTRLAGAIGHTPIYLHYNSGKRIADNGREFAALLEQLVANWPVPVEEIVLLGHSMGGLVSRSACHYGSAADHRWARQLRRMVFLGTPHHGTPLERAGQRFERLLGISPYTAPFTALGRIRSAGITDLREGQVTDDDHTPLPDNVDCYAIAAASGRRLSGDGLVPVDSALGRHEDPARHLRIPPEHQWISPGTSHIGLMHHRAVYRTLRRWLKT